MFLLLRIYGFLMRAAHPSHLVSLLYLIYMVSETNECL